ncbi:HPP family protein [Pseudoalteromonas sp. MMG012]|uniref:HPP family protein n=1 Tax=Pseudoalteromonas sp. MMG012 TaxID=2822686 RepID=UPI001B3A14B3|nr:HPP family protein [Pseudoalteromonas sp. MMG012]MBQ4852398.1 HPP family protein [Pseudoalteromonas sp. MMG012]
MKKLSGGGALPPKVNFIELLRGFVGGFVGILGLCFITSIAGYPLLMAPFGATCVILFAAAASPLAQPRNVIGGHFISALIGILALLTFGTNPWVMALSVGLAIVAMQFFRVVHPPAGANPLVILMAGSYHFDFLIFPVLIGSIFLVGIASLINNIGLTKKWPIYWFGSSSNQQ